MLLKAPFTVMQHALSSLTTASISDLKRDPMGIALAGDGFAVAILNRNVPAFYCVPAKVYASMLERLDDLELNALANARAGQEIVKVSIDEL